MAGLTLSMSFSCLMRLLAVKVFSMDFGAIANCLGLDSILAAPDVKLQEDSQSVVNWSIIPCLEPRFHLRLRFETKVP